MKENKSNTIIYMTISFLFLIFILIIISITFIFLEYFHNNNMVEGYMAIIGPIIKPLAINPSVKFTNTYYVNAKYHIDVDNIDKSDVF